MQTMSCPVNNGLYVSKAGKKPTALPKDLEGSESEEEADVEIQIPEHKVKLIIGAGGDKIKHIQRKSKCRVQVSCCAWSLKSVLILRPYNSCAVGVMLWKCPLAAAALKQPLQSICQQQHVSSHKADQIVYWQRNVGLQQQEATRLCVSDAAWGHWHAPEQSSSMAAHTFFCCY